MASSNTANWSVYSRNREAHVEGLLSWFEGPKYLPFALSATRMHLTPTSYQQTRQLFIRHKLAHQSQIRELPSGRPQSKGWERKGGLWLTALPFAQSTSPILSYFVFSINLQTASQVKLQNIWSQNEEQVKIELNKDATLKKSLNLHALSTFTVMTDMSLQLHWTFPTTLLCRTGA